MRQLDSVQRQIISLILFCCGLALPAFAARNDTTVALWAHFNKVSAQIDQIERIEEIRFPRGNPNYRGARKSIGDLREAMELLKKSQQQFAELNSSQHIKPDPNYYRAMNLDLDIITAGCDGAKKLLDLTDRMPR